MAFSAVFSSVTPAAPRTCTLASLGLLAALAPGATAQASPAVDSTRHLSLGNGARGSAYGVNAAVGAPASLNFSQQFAIEPMYQIKIQGRRHGMGAVIADSLNNPRVALGLGYLFMRGSPEIAFQDTAGEDQTLELSHFGHEAFAALSVAIVKNWFTVAMKPKYQYASLRYRDDDGVARNAHRKLNFFGLDFALALNIAGWVSVHASAENVVGNHPSAFTEDRELQLEGVDVVEDTIDHRSVSRLSDYPLTVTHGLSVFPLHHPDFSLNVDGTYDFTSYWKSDKHTRVTLGGSAEFVVGPVPLRAGSYWDGRGPGEDDDRVYVTGGLGYVKPASLGGVGVDVGIGVRQQVAGQKPLETILGLHVGLRIHPDL